MRRALRKLFGKKDAKQEGPPQQGQANPYALSVWYEPTNELDTKFDIVFVHGLTGNSTLTWQAKGADQPWPQTKLPKTFKQARIMTFGYDADVVRARERVSQNTMLQHAANFRISLMLKRQGSLKETMPLIFVAHSLGGLVCEQTLLLCNEHPDDDVKNIWRSTLGIIFMGTPQLGADLAPVARRLARIADLDPTRRVNHTLLDVLSRDSTQLATMQNGFRALLANRLKEHGSLPVLSLAEELAVKYIGQIVVTEQSSRFPAGFDEFGTIHADHMQMTKVQETDEDAYSLLVGMIRRWLETKAPVPIFVDDWRLGTKAFYQYPKRIKDFEPRDNLLHLLDEAMATKQIISKNSSRSVVLQGLGGSGKTQLAIEYCIQCESRRSVFAIFWAKASSRASMTNSFDEIWEAIKPQTPQTSQNIARKIDFVKKTLSSWYRPWLLVLDNYDDLRGFPGIMDFIPQSEFGQVLSTSRLQGLQRHDAFDHEIPVGGLDEEVALSMLLSKSGIASENCTSEIKWHAKTIVNRFGNLPLAIDQAAAYIQLSKASLESFIEQFDSAEADVLNTLTNDLSYVKNDPDGREERATICSTWELSFRMIRDEIPRTQQIKGYVLTLLSYLDARDISEEVFSQPLIPVDAAGERLFSESFISDIIACFMLQGRNWNLGAVYSLIGELTTLSLIQRFGHSQDRKHRVFSIHPLVRDWLKIRSNPHDRERCFLLAVCLLHACVAAQQRSSAGQQMSQSSEAEIRILRHLEALDADARLEIKSGKVGNMFYQLLPLIQQMSGTMSDIREEGLRQQLREIGQWLFAQDPYEYQRSILDRAVPGTGSSLLDSHKFERWTTSPEYHSILWLAGSPGTGKTFGVAATISYLNDFFLKYTGKKGAVVFFYIRDPTDSPLLLREIFGSLLKLLLAFENTRNLLGPEISDVRNLYDQYLGGKLADELPAILNILQRSINKLEICFILIDGLDLVSDRLMEALFSKMMPLLEITSVRLLIASHSTQSLREHLSNFEVEIVNFDSADRLDDGKRRYIHDRISLLAMKQDLKDRVEKFLLGQTYKSFLFLRLLLDELEGIRSEEDLYGQIQALPHSMDEFLETRFSHIFKSDSEIRQHSLLMIAWVLCSQAPVSLTAFLPIFYPNLQVEIPTGAVGYFQRITGNLVVFDGTDGIPRFTHSSVKEYLETSRSGRMWSYYRSRMGGRWPTTPRFISQPGPNTGLRNLPYGHATFALECLKQLSNDMLDFGTSGPSLQQAQTLAFEHQFLKYAAVYWGVHVTLYNDDLEGGEPMDDKIGELTTRSVNFLADHSKLKTSLVVVQYLRESGESKDNPLAKLTPESTALDVARSFKLPDIIMAELFRALAEL